MFSAMSDSLLNHGAAYLGLRCKGTKKNNRFTHLSVNLWPFFPRLVTFPCVSVGYKAKKLEYKSWWLSYIAEYKEDRWSTILLLAWSCGRIIGAMLGAVKKRAENGIFQWNAKNGVTALQYNNITVLKNQNQNFEPKFYI